MHHDTITTTIAHSAAIQTHYNGDDTWNTTLRTLILMLIEYIIWNGVVLALDEQDVYLSEFECVFTWCMMHYDTIAIAHLAAIQTHLMAHGTQLCAANFGVD